MNITDKSIRIYEGAFPFTITDFLETVVDFSGGEMSYAISCQNAFYELMMAKYDFNPENHSYMLKGTEIENLHYTMIHIMKTHRTECMIEFKEYMSVNGYQKEQHNGKNYYSKSKNVSTRILIGAKEYVNYLMLPTDKVTVEIKHNNDATHMDFDNLHEAHQFINSSKLDDLINDFNKINIDLAHNEIIDKLTEAYSLYVEAHDLPNVCAEELLQCHQLPTPQVEWLRSFSDIWDETMR